MPSSVVDQVVQTLRARRETISFAESCTGGLLASSLASLPGVSDVFVGSVVAYSNQVKENLLGVSSSLLRSMGAVSLPVARTMAQGARGRFNTTWSIAITGIAGPSGGSPEKPVGTVCFAVSGPGVDEVEQVLLAGSRTVIQQAAVDHALKMLLGVLSGK